MKRNVFVSFEDIGWHKGLIDALGKGIQGLQAMEHNTDYLPYYAFKLIQTCGDGMQDHKASCKYWVAT